MSEFERSQETARQLRALRDEIGGVIERHFGRSSFVLTFVGDGSAVAKAVVGGERMAAVLALKGLIDREPEEGDLSASVLDDMSGSTYFDVRWKTIKALAALRQLK